MARIVYFSFPAHGHINPTLPVVRELVHREEQVVYYSTERFRHALSGTGAVFRPYSARFRMPETGPGPFGRISTTLEILLDLTGAVLDCHLEEVKRFSPTHIMHDSFAPWGGLVAQLLRLPSIASVPSILINRDIDCRYGAEPEDPGLTPQWYAGFSQRCRATLQSYGLAEPPAPPQLLQTYAGLNLVYTSRLFQPLAEAFDGNRFQFVGPLIGFRSDAPPFPFDSLDGRPLVLVSLGTVYGNQPRFLRTSIEALADRRWQVVLSTGENVAGVDLGHAPDNFIVRRFVPQLQILRRAAAFVTRGGMNSVQEALYYGVPLAIAPLAADQFWIAARARELGAAVVLDTPHADAGAICAAVERLLSDPSYAAAAAHIGASLRAAGGHVRAADEIQSFVRRTAPGSAVRGPEQARAHAAGRNL